MQKKLAFILTFFLFSILTFAQKKFTPGYLIKSNGDTLRGYLEEEVRENLLEQIKFKTQLSDPSFQKFSVSDAIAFKYELGGLYKVISFKNNLQDSSGIQTCFALQLGAGTYSLFSFYFNEKIYFVVIAADSSHYLYNSAYNNNGEVKVEGNYISQLQLLASACDAFLLHPEVVEYNEKQIAKFISDLNRCVNPDKVSLNYYKKPQTKSQLVIFAGGLPMGTRNQLTAEAAIRLSYPQISKNIFFNVGLHYSHTLKTRVDRDNGNFKFTRSIKDDIFGVPVTLQYNLSNWIIKPYISGGVGFNYLKEFTSNDPNPNSTYIAPKNQFNISPIACIGIEGYVTQKLFIKAEWRYEILLQYPAIGIAYLF